MYESKKSRFLGDTPTHISKGQLFDYFLYTFEFLWTSPTYDTYKESISVHFKRRLDALKDKQEKPLTIGQEWWALVFFALKDLAESERYAYSTETIQFIINRIHILSDDELENYANSINDVLYDEVPDILVIRPLEVEKLNSDAYQKGKVLAYFLERKEEFLLTFKKHLEEKDIEKMYINQLALNDKAINEPFTDLWRSYFEMFTGYSIAMFDMVLKLPQQTEEFKEQLLKEVNLVFLIASVKNSSKIDAINSELTELLRPLYLKEE